MRAFMNKLLIALFLSLLASPAAADTLIGNVNGIQIGADGKLQRFNSLIIREDGKVRQTLRGDEEVRLAGITRQIDGGGRTLLPGLIDAHGHIMGLGIAAIQLDLT